MYRTEWLKFATSMLFICFGTDSARSDFYLPPVSPEKHLLEALLLYRSPFPFISLSIPYRFPLYFKN